MSGPEDSPGHFKHTLKKALKKNEENQPVQPVHPVNPGNEKLGKKDEAQLRKYF